MRIIVTLSILALLLSGCSSSNTVKTTPKEATPAAKANLSDPAIVINQEKISSEDFKRRLYKARFVQSAQGADYSNPQNAEVYNGLKEHTIKVIVKETIVMQEAAKQGIITSDAQVEDVINGIKSRFPSEEIFRETMLSRGLDEETMREYNRLQITSVELMQKLGGREAYDQFINTKIEDANIERNAAVLDILLEEIRNTPILVKSLQPQS